MRTCKLLVLTVCCLMFFACSDKHDYLGDWEKSVPFSGSPRLGAVGFVIKNDDGKEMVYVGTGFGNKQTQYNDFKKFDGFAWDDVRIKDIDQLSARLDAVAFVIGNKAYIGTGYIYPITGSEDTQARYLKDFYCLDPDVEDGYDFKIVKMQDFPAEERRGAVAFALGNYGYVGTGRDKDNSYNDMYRFDPSIDPESPTSQWTKIPFIGEQRSGAVSFILGGSAYVCLGSGPSGSYPKDVLKFTPNSDGTGTWLAMQALADKPDNKQDKDYDLIPRANAVAFVSDKGVDGEEYAYIMGGQSGSGYYTFKYNPRRDTWHQVEDIPSRTAPLPIMSVGFTYGGYGYFTTGGGGTESPTVQVYNATWKFIPDVKEWRGNDY